MAEKQQSQADKFKKAAREHGADPSVKRWNERLKAVSKPKGPFKRPDEK